VLKAAQRKGRPPQVSDVQEAAVEIIQSPGAIERQQDELMHRYERAARELKVGLAVQVLTKPFKVKLIGVLLQISEAVNVMIAVLKSSTVAERTEQEEARAARAILK
jgi:hypothetical protein